MKGLKTQDNFLIFMAYDIRFGKLDEFEPEIDKWGMYDEDDKILVYAIDNDFSVVEFDSSIIPEDYVQGKYFFIDGEFVENPDYIPPLPPIDEQVKLLGEGMVEMGDNVAQVAADLDFIAMELGVDLDD